MKSRDAALVRADERLRSLAELFLQIEAKTTQLARDGESGKDTGIGKPGEPAAATAIATAVRSSCAVLRRDLESDAWLFGGRETLRVA